MTFLHFNCRSLKRNFEKLVCCLESINQPVSIIGISESWLKKQDDNYINLSHYSFVGNSRTTKKGGGVGIYIYDTLTFKRRTDLEVFNDTIEGVCIEILGKGKSYIVLVVYRPPNYPVSRFIEFLMPVLNAISIEDKECVLMGDFNVDIMNYNHSAPVNDFVDTLCSFSLIPQIIKPTRITSHCATNLDNIFCNHPDKVIQSGIVITDVSDHLTPFVIVSTSIFNGLSNTGITIHKRIFNDDNIKLFQNKLQLVNWECLNSLQDVDEQFDKFLSTYLNVFEECFPVTTLKIKSTINRKPWFTSYLKKICRKKHKLYKKFVNNPSSHRETVYKTYRNFASDEIRKSKRKYYNNKFNNLKNNPRGTWKVINEVLHKDTKKREFQIVDSNGANIVDKNVIANRFNSYFCKIGLDIQENVASSNTTETRFDKYLAGNVVDSLFFSKVALGDILNVVHKLDPKKSPGFDTIDPKIVKLSICAIVNPLCDIFNASLVQGKFPSSLKMAKVIPVFKNGDRSKLTNYRPISVLTVFSKIF